MSSEASLDATAQERKARLARLKSLKRRQSEVEDAVESDINEAASSENNEPSITASTYLSGRNYDTSNRAPKLGFDQNPNGGQSTVEVRAKELVSQVQEEMIREEKEDLSLDLFKLKPKKANWDLKRDMEKKMEILNVRTDNAIARLVRERVTAQKQSSKDEGLAVSGEELVTALHTREMQDKEEGEKERQLDGELDEDFT